jgi:integrase
MLNVAEREGWILWSPFAAGDSLISLADEKKRERILTREEEIKLLAACDTPQRAHLKAIVICALDTGMHRSGRLGVWYS